MPPLVASLLTFYRIIRLLINTVTNLLIVLLTLGLVGRFRDKLGIYLTQLAWLALGRPEHWGLPDKCPCGRDPDFGFHHHRKRGRPNPADEQKRTRVDG